MKKKFYAVAVGRQSGVFTDWPTAEAQVKGFAGARYQSFPSREEALLWLEDPVYKKKAMPPPSREKQESVQPEIRPGAVAVFTDGGCINNPGPGGYGVVIVTNGDRREISGGFRRTTNNRMEMMAAIVALEGLRGCDTAIDLYSDSSYLVNGIVKGWAKKWRDNSWHRADGGEVMNIDLWQRLLILLDILAIRFHWVKGHAGNEENERCDRLAVAAANGTDLAEDAGYAGAAGSEGCHDETTL